MPDSKAHIDAAAFVATRKRKNVFVKVLQSIPYFLYLLMIFLIIKTYVPDVRDVFVTFGSYSLTWVEVIYLLATAMAMSELLRVSEPGMDNTKEALFMLLVGVGFLVLFVLGAAQLPVFAALFNNTEFLMITLVSIIQIVLAFMINARTLKRTIDYTGGE